MYKNNGTFPVPAFQYFNADCIPLGTAQDSLSLHFSNTLGQNWQVDDIKQWCDNTKGIETFLKLLRKETRR